MRLAAPALSALLALAGCQHAAYQAATRSLQVAPPPMDHGLDAQVLSSGLTLAVFQVPGQRDVTVSLALGGGRSDEPDGKAGLAQVALRAALRAPRGRGGATVQEALHAAGALVGAAVNLDETTLAVRCRPSFQGDVMVALGGLLAEPEAGVDDETVRQAREELATSLEGKAATEEAVALEVQRVALEGTPFARATPTPEGVRALTLQDVGGFLRASFAAPRALLWLSTGRDAEHVARQVVAALPGPAVGDPARPVAPGPGYSAVPPPERLPTRTLELTGGPEPRLLLAWRAPGIRFGPAASLAAVGLRDHLGRRAAKPDLAAKVRHVTASLHVLDRASVLVIEVGLKRPEDAGPVRHSMLETSWLAAEFWRGRTREGEAALRQELRLDRELELAEGWVGPVGRLVRAVGSADVPAWLDLNERSQDDRAARAWLDAWVTPGPTVVATVAAAPDASAVGADEQPSGASQPRPEGQRTWPTAASLVASAVPGSEQLERLLEPAGLEEAREERLPNGLRLLALRRPAAPFAMLLLRLPGGAVRVSEGLAAQRALAAARSGLHEAGCGLAPEARGYAAGVDLLLSGPVAWLPAVAEGISCWSGELSAPRQRPPTPDEIIPWLSYEALLTGGDVPSAPGGQAWADAYLRRLRGAGGVAILAGDVEPGQAMARLREVLGRFPDASTAAPALPATPPWPTRRRVLLEDVPGAKLASAVVLLRLPGAANSTSVERLVLEALVLDRAERTFEPSGFEVTSRRARAGEAELTGVALSGPAALVPAAVGEHLRELARLRDRGPAKVEADAARWDAARNLAYAFDSTPGAAWGLGQLARNGLPLDTWNGVAARLRGVDASSLQTLARGAAVGAESILLRGDAATLVPLLRSEGLVPEVFAPPSHLGGAPR